MSLNLHNVVRGAIQAVNQDRIVPYLQSCGYTPNASGKQVPNYANPVAVSAQIQPPSGRDLRHMEYLNIQGTTRTVYLYSDPQAIVRVDARGGDLLQFPQFRGRPPDNWLIVHVDETWDSGPYGWSKVYVVLQTDRGSVPNYILASGGNFVEDSSGDLVYAS